MVYFLFHALYLAIKNTAMLSESQDAESVEFMSQLTSYLLLYVQEIVKSGNIRGLLTQGSSSESHKDGIHMNLVLHIHLCLNEYKARLKCICDPTFRVPSSVVQHKIIREREKHDYHKYIFA